MTSTEIEAAVDALLAEHHIKYEAKFKPTPQPNEKHPMIHWIVTIGGQSFDYFQGIGHLPEYCRKFSDKEQRNIAEVGRRLALGGSPNGMRVKLTPPVAASVLHCLCSDADAENHDTFEEWASEFGYDPDSRSAEKTYQACLENARKLRRALGHVLMGKVMELVREY